MIVVDTSVWIDVLNEHDTLKAQRCIGLLEDGAPLAVTDVIVTEILQGLRSDREASRVEGYLRHFPILRLEAVDDFVSAAALCRRARARGVTIRSTVDCLIASVCIREQAPILHSDDDFERIASTSNLQIFV